MGAPTGCVRKPRTSFSIMRFWAKCLKCGHQFIAYEMTACVGGRGDSCDRCGSKRHKFVRALTPEERRNEGRDLTELLVSIRKKRFLKK